MTPPTVKAAIKLPQNHKTRLLKPGFNFQTSESASFFQEVIVCEQLPQTPHLNVFNLAENVRRAGDDTSVKNRKTYISCNICHKGY